VSTNSEARHVSLNPWGYLNLVRLRFAPQSAKKQRIFPSRLTGLRRGCGRFDPFPHHSWMPVRYSNMGPWRICNQETLEAGEVVWLPQSRSVHQGPEIRFPKEKNFPVRFRMWPVFSDLYDEAKFTQPPIKSAVYRAFPLTFPQAELRLSITSDPFQDRMGPEPRTRHRSLALGPFNLPVSSPAADWSFCA
jgi:hypothetical protein